MIARAAPARQTHTYFRVRPKCPVCSSAPAACLLDLAYDSGPIDAHVRRYYGEKGRFEPSYLIGARYRVMECGECQLMYQEAVPNDELLERVYSVWVDPSAAERRYVRGDKLDQYLSELWLLRFWRSGESLRVLDFGMGHGRWCEVAAMFGHDVDGYDFENFRQISARDRGVSVVAYDDMTPDSYDFINTEQVFEHLTEPLPTLRHLAAALKPGGMIRLSVPNGHLVKAHLASGRELVFAKRHRFGLNPIEPLQHVNCFTHTPLDRLAAEAGLRRFRFPLRDLIAARQQWWFPRGWVTNALRPVYHRLRYDDGTSLYFCKPARVG